MASGMERSFEAIKREAESLSETFSHSDSKTKSLQKTDTTQEGE
jgi:hypothetical protein